MTNWILDLDNTLYPAGSELFQQVDDRINLYMTGVLGFGLDEADELRVRYREKFGVTLRGLMNHHGVDPDHYMDFVHDVDYLGLLSPDPQLRQTLADLDGRKVIFTNGSVPHAESVLARLGVRDCVGDIFDLGFMDYQPKPLVHGYVKLMEAIGAKGPECWMVDDMAVNLDTAFTLDMQTVLVGPEPVSPHLHVTSPSGLPQILG